MFAAGIRAAGAFALRRLMQVSCGWPRVGLAPDLQAPGGRAHGLTARGGASGARPAVDEAHRSSGRARAGQNFRFVRGAGTAGGAPFRRGVPLNWGFAVDAAEAPVRAGANGAPLP